MGRDSWCCWTTGCTSSWMRSKLGVRGLGGHTPPCRPASPRRRSLLGPPRDRSALCQLWRAVILRDEAAMKAHAAELGVQGEAGVGVRRGRGHSPGSGPPRLLPVLRGAHAAACAPGAAVALTPAEP